ncbi:unnamed protein product [Gongylonema pulchrum]|nr:unnamed protein product [Gongylonema pulchrum]
MNSLSEETVEWGSEDVHYLLAPYQCINKVAGKKIRSHLATAFNFWLKVDTRTVEAIISLVEMLHNASLM